jgi:hypothetical protein
MGAALGFYRLALGLGLVLMATRTPMIAPWVAVRGRSYVARIARLCGAGLGFRSARGRPAKGDVESGARAAWGS